MSYDDSRYSESEIDPVFRSIVNHWLTKVKKGKDHKREVFSRMADDCRSFYNGPREWEDILLGEGGNNKNEIIDCTFKVSVNKAFEFVSIFGPALYFDNPVRTVKPRMPVIVPQQFFGADVMTYEAMIQQENMRVMKDGLTSVLLEAYLNWTPIEFNLDEESRLAVHEALLIGRGCAWTELYSPPGTNMNVVRSVYDTTDNLITDPDAPSFKKSTWIARMCVHPVWQVERDFGLRRGSIKGNCESQAKQADIETSDESRYDRKRGFTNDLLIYWKIYSKMGVGGRLQGVNKDLREPLEMFGDYAYIVVAEGTPYPLNFSPDVTNDPKFATDPQAIFAKLAWPTPFWGDDDWPVSPLDFHPIHNCPWPLPTLKAGMGELKFLNWCMSFLMGKIRNTTRDFIAIKKEAGEEIKTTLLEGKDLTLIELEAAHGTISELVQFLQHPEVNGDIWKMIQEVEGNFDKRVGLMELMYGAGGATQIRSAEEVKQRNLNMNIRPDDMRRQVEKWQTRIAIKESVAARYHLIASDVVGALGQMGAWAWAQFVSTRDIYQACHQLEHRIEAGSTARPNKEWEVETMDAAFEKLAPVFQAYAQQTMDMKPLNNLVADTVKAHDLDPARYQLLSPMLPPPPPTPGDSGAPGHQNQATTGIAPPG